MELIQHSEYIYSTTYETKRDRPSLGYIKGSNFSVMVDAGTSAQHVKEAYALLKEHQLPLPTFTILTHWHWDHTFGMHAISGISIANDKTNEFLKEQKEQAKDTNYIEILKKEDVHFWKEYCGQDNLNIVLADVAFSDKMTLDLGGITAQIFHTVSPHSEDTTCVYVPGEKVLFLGDATSEDFFNGGYMDKEKLESLIQMIRSTECDYCILSHCEPLTKEGLLCYLESVL